MNPSACSVRVCFFKIWDSEGRIRKRTHHNWKVPRKAEAVQLQETGSDLHRVLDDNQEILGLEATEAKFVQTKQDVFNETSGHLYNQIKMVILSQNMDFPKPKEMC